MNNVRLFLKFNTPFTLDKISKIQKKKFTEYYIIVASFSAYFSLLMLI